MQGSGVQAARDPTARRVLVVDDNEDTVESFATLLGMMGHQVKTSRDGRQALAIATDWRPQLVMLDLNLPGLNGCELAQALRAAPGLEGITIAAVTGWTRKRDKQAALAAGCNHYLLKPVSGDQLEGLLTDLPPAA